MDPLYKNFLLYPFLLGLTILSVSIGGLFLLAKIYGVL